MTNGPIATAVFSVIAAIALLQLHHVVAFAPQPPLIHRYGSTTTSLFMGKKKQKGPPKVSYAERLQRQREQKAKEQGVAPPPPINVARGGEIDDSTKQLAKEMVAAQRKSVDMLTFIRERVEGLPWTPIMEGLKKEGYVVVDDFLANDDAVSQLQGEGIALFEQGMMSTDLTKLGSGEYFCAVGGGEEQYLVCPRTIELVVSVTKHMPPCLSEYDLDGANCMAGVRTYDRSSQQASLSLLNGEELPVQPFDIVATEENDGRKVTLLYYVTDADWQSGGVVIEEGERLLSAKRDRLIILLSDSCRHRPEYFEGSDEQQSASCLELHLIAKPKK